MFGLGKFRSLLFLFRPFGKNYVLPAAGSSSYLCNHPIIMTTESNKSQFMLLLRQPSEGPHPTPEEMQKIMARFMEWMKGMGAQGILVASNGLDDTGKVLRGPQGASMSDGPYPEAKEIVGGYVLITADNIGQAVAIARDCPGLDYRMAVEVRPVKHQQAAEKAAILENPKKSCIKAE